MRRCGDTLSPGLNAQRVQKLAGVASTSVLQAIQSVEDDPATFQITLQDMTGGIPSVESAAALRGIQ